jgi:ectoine hydroxylase-related dioxygenase (phytanoyl-CoA dioxygenase family)
MHHHSSFFQLLTVISFPWDSHFTILDYFCQTAIYYINQADGDTVIFHEIEQAERYRPMHKSTPEKGKLLMFNGWHYHASSCPKMFAKRIALTMNFTAKKK